MLCIQWYQIVVNRLLLVFQFTDAKFQVANGLMLGKNRKLMSITQQILPHPRDSLSGTCADMEANRRTVSSPVRSHRLTNWAIIQYKVCLTSQIPHVLVLLDDKTIFYVWVMLQLIYVRKITESSAQPARHRSHGAERHCSYDGLGDSNTGLRSSSVLLTWHDKQQAMTPIIHSLVMFSRLGSGCKF